MAKMFAIIQMVGGLPDLDGLPYTGYVLVDQLSNFGAYLISGSDAQLLAINALSQVVGIVGVTDSGESHWAELDNTITVPIRTKINTFLTSKSLTNIPAGWSYRQVITAVYQRFNPLFDLARIYVVE